jgi:hypothetical protein
MHAFDPNRSFRADSPAQESAALMRLVAAIRDSVLVHIDCMKLPIPMNPSFAGAGRS